MISALIAAIASGTWVGANSLWSTLDGRLAAQEARLREDCERRVDARIQECAARVNELKDWYDTHCEGPHAAARPQP